MEQQANPTFRRRLAFRRSKTGKSFWGPEITYELHTEDGAEVGKLVLEGKKASYTSVRAQGDNFEVKTNFWGGRWRYLGDDKREFGRWGFGWDFRPWFAFPAGEKYKLRIKTRWALTAPAPDKPTRTINFLRDDIPVMLLQGFTPRTIFSNRLTEPMEGTLSTDLPDDRTVAALLMFYHTFTASQQRSAH